MTNSVRIWARKKLPMKKTLTALAAPSFAAVIHLYDQTPA